jgi:hypothetical protein
MENIVIAGMIIGIIAYIIKKRRGIQLKTTNKQK